jgi:hypothetical protein
MNIKNYKTLISSLPVRQQYFTTKRAAWTKAEREMEWACIFHPSNPIQVHDIQE